MTHTSNIYLPSITMEWDTGIVHCGHPSIIKESFLWLQWLYKSLLKQG